MPQKKNYLKITITILSIGFIFLCFQPQQTIQISEINVQQDTTSANELKREAEVLASNGQHEAAVNLLEKAKRLFEQHQLWKYVVECTVRQSFFADNLAIDTKRHYATQSLLLAKKYLSKNHIQLGKAHQQIAEVQMIYEEYDSSITSFNHAIKILEKHKKWNDYTWAIISKSINYYYLGDYEPFEKDLYKAQELYKKHNLEEEIYITILDLLSFVYNEKGDFDKAIENTKSSIRFYLKKVPTDSVNLAVNYLNIGQYYSEMGASQQANSHFYKAIEFSKNSNLENYTNALFYLCGEAYGSENYHKSIDLGHDIISLIQNISFKGKQEIQCLTYNYIGASYMYLHQFDSSEWYLQKAINTPKNKYSLIAEIDYSTLLLEQKKTKQAFVILSNVNVSELSQQYSKSLLSRNLGRVYGQKNDFQKSLFHFQKSLFYNLPEFTDTLNFYKNPTVLRQVKNPIFFLNDLKYKAYHLSQFSENTKNLEAALATYDVAFRWIDTLMQFYSYDDSRVINNQRNREIYEQAIDVAYQLYQRTNDKKYIKKAFLYAEKIKSNVLLSDLQTYGNQVVMPKRIQDKEKELAANVAFYERQLQLAKDNKEKDKVDLYRNYLIDYRMELGELKDSIKDNFPQYYDLKYSAKLANVSTIQTDLNNKQGFVSYYSGDSSTYVFTISKDDFHFSKLDSTSIIDDKIIAFRQMLDYANSSIEGFTKYNENATDLYMAVLQHSIKKLPKSVTQLTIVPDGTLNYIPFEILTSKTVQASQDFSKLPYLLYDFQINYAYSATLLRENERLQNQLKTNNKCLAYAPPYENKKPTQKGRGTMRTLRDGTMQLQGTGKEIQAIATHFDGDFDQSETATKAKFIKQAPNFGILHLAMHGEANFENENLANLKFTNTKSQNEEQYLLYQNEIANMDLNAQLVVLSACETGLGKYIYGEGIASLGRSFMYAGVPSIVMSLWKVDDKATSRLMPYFYENLSNGINKDEALHQAKLTFLKKEDFSTLHPYYWAGFVSIGDIQPIKKGRNWGIWLIVGASLLLLGSGFLLWKKFNNKA